MLVVVCAVSDANQIIRWSTALAMLSVTGVAAVALYEYALDVAWAYGESGWKADVVPLTVDGLIDASSMVMLTASVTA